MPRHGVPPLWGYSMPRHRVPPGTPCLGMVYRGGYTSQGGNVFRRHLHYSHFTKRFAVIAQGCRYGFGCDSCWLTDAIRVER